MTAPTDASVPVLNAVSGEAPGRAAAPGSRPTGPDLLGEAAVVLRVVVGRGPVRWADVRTAIYRAACIRGAGRDRLHRLLLTDEAVEMFTEYLVADGLAAPTWDPSHGWLSYTHPVDVQLALAVAAGHWRRELDSVGSTPVSPTIPPTGAKRAVA
jgi:hypothetical protein